MGDIYHEFLLFKNVIHLPTSFINDITFRICVKVQNSNYVSVVQWKVLSLLDNEFLVTYILKIDD